MPENGENTDPGLPLPPSVDSTRTSQFRSFLPGSAGPHMDVLLFNQAALARQMQELRAVVEQLINKNGISTRPTAPPAEVDIDESHENEIEWASRRFLSKGGVMKNIRIKKLGPFVTKWVQGLKTDQQMADSAKDALEALNSDQQATIHVTIASRINPKKKRKAAPKATKPKGDKGPSAKTKGKKRMESNEDEEQEEEEDENEDDPEDNTSEPEAEESQLDDEEENIQPVKKSRRTI